MAERVLPVLRLAVLCESIEEDADGRPYRLVVPVHTLRWPTGVRGRYRPPTLNLYVQLQNPAGTFYLRAVLRHESGSAEIYDTSPLELRFDTSLGAVPYELAVELDELTFPRPGAYEIVIHANHVSLHDPELAPVPFPPIRVVVLPADGSVGGVL